MVIITNVLYLLTLIMCSKISLLSVYFFIIYIIINHQLVVRLILLVEIINNVLHLLTLIMYSKISLLSVYIFIIYIIINHQLVVRLILLLVIINNVLHLLTVIMSISQLITVRVCSNRSYKLFIMYFMEYVNVKNIHATNSNIHNP